MALPAEPLRAPSAVAVCALALPARAKAVTSHTSQCPKNPPPPPHDTRKLWTGASGVKQNGFQETSAWSRSPWGKFLPARGSWVALVGLGSQCKDGEKQSTSVCHPARGDDSSWHYPSLAVHRALCSSLPVCYVHAHRNPMGRRCESPFCSSGKESPERRSNSPEITSEGFQPAPLTPEPTCGTTARTCSP